MLELDGLGRRYGSRWAVRELSATLRPGEVVGFLGPNGAGKTTTIKMIAGLLIPSEGSVRLCGHDVEKEPEQAKQRLAYVPDRPYVPERLSARELLRYVAGLYGLEPAVVDELGVMELARFGLAGREDDLLGTYSHGMRQRALLASAFMRRPSGLLVDEPMVGLEPAGARLVKRMLRQAAEGGAVVLMSTHTLSVVEEVCDRVLMVGRGRLVADGDPRDLVAQMAARGGDEEANLEDLLIALTSEKGETP